MFGINFDPFGWLTSLLSGLGNAILNLVQYLLNEAWSAILWLLSLLPSLPLFPVALSDVSLAFGFVMTNLHIVQILTAWNYYCALNVGIVFAATAIIAEGVASGFHVLRWLLSKLPFIGGAE